MSTNGDRTFDKTRERMDAWQAGYDQGRRDADAELRERMLAQRLESWLDGFETGDEFKAEEKKASRLYWEHLHDVEVDARLALNVLAIKNSHRSEIARILGDAARLLRMLIATPREQWPESSMSMGERLKRERVEAAD